MNLSKARHKIEFGTIQNVATKANFTEKKFIGQFKLFAEVKNLYGKEFWEAKASQSQDVVKFKTRYNKNVKSTMRIKFKENIYEIIHIDNINYLNKDLEIKAKILEKDKL